MYRYGTIDKENLFLRRTTVNITIARTTSGQLEMRSGAASFHLFVQRKGTRQSTNVAALKDHRKYPRRLEYPEPPV